MVPALTLGGLVHAAGDDGPLDTEPIGVSTRPTGPATSLPAETSAAAPGPDAVPPSGAPSSRVPAQSTDPPPATPFEQPPPESQSAEEAAATSAPPPTAAEGDAAGQTAAAEAQAAEARAAEVLAAVSTAGSRARGTVQVVVLGPDGREQLASPGAGVPTWTASLVKAFVVQQLLDADGERQPVAPEDLRLLERALSSSDDDAMNTLWVRFDGPALVTEAATEFGLPGTAAPTDVSQWGQATTTARDYAAFLHRLRFALDDAELATLTGWLQSTTDRAADGFDQTFGLRSRAADTGAPVAVKQGWMCCVDGRRQLHSAGSLADGRTVVLLGDFPASTSWATARTALDEAARAVVARP